MAFSDECKDMLLDAESEKHGHNNHSWKSYMCPLLTLYLIMRYESVGSLSPQSVGKCKCGIQTEKSHRPPLYFSNVKMVLSGSHH